MRLPRLGTKSEFWTLVRVDRAETSGSMKGKDVSFRGGHSPRQSQSLTNHVQHVNHLRPILIRLLLLLGDRRHHTGHGGRPIPRESVQSRLTSPPQDVPARWLRRRWLGMPRCGLKVHYLRRRRRHWARLSGFLGHRHHSHGGRHPRQDIRGRGGPPSSARF